MVAEGLPNKLIARRLEISEKTVKAHLTSVFRQIGVTDRTQAALWAERHGVRRGVLGPMSDCGLSRPRHDRRMMSPPMTVALALGVLARSSRRRLPRVADAETTIERRCGARARARARARRRCACARTTADPGRARDRDRPPRVDVGRDPAARTADRLPGNPANTEQRLARAQAAVPDWLGSDTVVARATGPRRDMPRRGNAVGLLPSLRHTGFDEEGRTRVHPQARSSGAHGRADPRALPRPAGREAAPQGQRDAFYAPVLPRHDAVAPVCDGGVAQARHRRLVPRPGSSTLREIPDDPGRVAR